MVLGVVVVEMVVWEIDRCELFEFVVGVVSVVSLVGIWWLCG